MRKILIPNKPHLDPIAAIYLLQEYGEDKFPGIKEAQFCFWEDNSEPDENYKIQWEKEGGIMIDLGGGVFDHHQAGDAHETCASLVASYLGIESNPELSALLSYVREDDLQGMHNRYGELAYLVKCLYKQKVSSQKTVEFILTLIKRFQATQKEWHFEVKKEYEEKCNIIRVKRNDKKIKIGIIKSNNPQVANYGLTVDNLAVAINQRSSGHVFILTNKHHRVNLQEIVAAIRKRELELRGWDKPIEISRLYFEGKNNLVPYWFYHKTLNAFLNGSEAMNKTEPTKIPFDEIIHLVLYGVSTENSEHCDCDQGGGRCPFAPYGFSKCARRKRRF